VEESQTQAQLIAEQLARFKDNISSRMDRTDESIRHHAELETAKLTALTDEVAQLRIILNDHEQRIRAATDGVTSFKVWSGLAGGGSSLLAIISFFKAWFGGP
jgi:hypothetical protein